jgi:hypothetical protein
MAEQPPKFDPTPTLDSVAAMANGRPVRQAAPIGGDDPRVRRDEAAGIDPGLPKTPVRVGFSIDVGAQNYPGGYVQRACDLRLSFAEASALKLVLYQLESEGARLADGTLVRRPEQAIQWMLQESS